MVKSSGGRPGRVSSVQRALKVGQANSDSLQLRMRSERVEPGLMLLLRRDQSFSSFRASSVFLLAVWMLCRSFRV
jgi:hypothetical protein